MKEDPRLEEIEGRYQVPWLVAECSPQSPASVYEEADGLETICCIPGYYSPEAQNHLARQIATAPTDIAYLLAELRKAQDKLAGQGQPHSTPTGRRAMTISDEAVEAAAKAAHASRWPNAPWDALNDDARAYARKNARLALEAAAPFIRAQALEDAAEHFEKEASQADMADAFFDYASGYAAGMRAAAAWIKGGLGWLI